MGRIEEVARRYPGTLVRAWLEVAEEERWGAAVAERIENAFGSLETLTPDEADALADPISYRSVALYGMAALLAERAAEGVPGPDARIGCSDDELAEYARRFGSRGFRQSKLRKRDEALASTTEAVALMRELVVRKGVAFLPNLAVGLNNLGGMQNDLGMREEALKSTEEAVGYYRELTDQRRDSYLSALAATLNNLSLWQSDLGMREEALKSGKEAVGYYRELAEQRRDPFLSDLAMALNNLGSRQSELGKRKEALAAAEESVALRRALAEDRRDSILPGLAASLNDLGKRQSELGKWGEALASTEEAVAGASGTRVGGVSAGILAKPREAALRGP